MRQLDFRGGWYCAARPNGAYAVQIRDSYIRTHLGVVPQSPGGNLLQLDISPDGPRFAGHGGNSFNAFGYDGDQWFDRGPAFGNNACVYDNAGVLHVVRDSEPPTWALGWAYCADDGTLIPTWQVYEPTTDFARSKGVVDLWWWTERGGIIIGQGPRGGLVAQFEGKRYQIAEGSTTFPRFNRDGNDLALAWVREDTNSAHVLFFTVDELRQFPLVAEPPVLIDHGGEVLPTPPPAKEPEPMPIANQIGTVVRVRAQYPTPLGARHGAFLVEVAKATGAKLLKKDSGTHVALSNGVNVSQDILMFGDQGVDILGDGEGAATPNWTEKGTIAGEYVDVSGFGAEPVPVPGVPVPLPGTVPGGLTIDLAPALAPLFAKVAALEARAKVLEGGLADANAAIAAAHGATQAATALLDGARIALKAWTGEHVTVEPDGTINAHGPRPFGEYQVLTVEVQR